MNTAQLGALMRGIAPALRDAIAGATAPILERMASFETRLESLPPGPPGPAGTPGKDGVPGKDGLGVGDLDVAYDGERSFTLRWTAGDRVVERSFTVPVVLDRGVFTAGKSYVPGDAVSYQGSVWIAQGETGDQPGTTKSWRLAVKHGRDGRNGKDGDRGPEGPAGRNGLDLTQVDDGGKKWR